jgi:NAD(P)-dependent dehydrogenase (short-subunit alcohol dehydrogenase family)
MKKVLITGANRGIGLALCKQFSARGDHVIAVCRHSSAGLDMLKVQIEKGVDVTRDEDVAALVARLDGQRIDYLVLNAGVLSRESLDALTPEAFDAIRYQFEVNTLGPLRMTAALRGNMKEGGKIGIITSRMGSLEDNSSGGYYGYRVSKAGVNAVGKSLAIDFKPHKVGVFLLHPGFVRTDMVGGNGDISADEAAANLTRRLDGLTLASTGTFWHANGDPLPW